jgi:site-specific DNA recombinase
MSERCAIYARANSLFDPSHAIVPQVEACEAYFRQTGWEFVATNVDFGPSNRPSDMRGGFHSLLNEAAQGAFDILLIYDKSHISTNARDLRSFERRLREANVRVREVDHVEEDSRRSTGQTCGRYA